MNLTPSEVLRKMLSIRSSNSSVTPSSYEKFSTYMRLHVVRTNWAHNKVCVCVFLAIIAEEESREEKIAEKYRLPA